MTDTLLKLIDPADRIGSFWCSVIHDSPMWPIHGRYECRTCGRHFEVPWADIKATGPLPVAHQPVVRTAS
jgi:hypothetical protein